MLQSSSGKRTMDEQHQWLAFECPAGDAVQPALEGLRVSSTITVKARPVGAALPSCVRAMGASQQCTC